MEKKRYESIWVNSLTTRSWAHNYDRPIERKVKKKKHEDQFQKKNYVEG